MINMKSSEHFQKWLIKTKKFFLWESKKKWNRKISYSTSKVIWREQKSKYRFEKIQRTKDETNQCQKRLTANCFKRGSNWQTSKLIVDQCPNMIRQFCLFNCAYRSLEDTIH